MADGPAKAMLGIITGYIRHPAEECARRIAAQGLAAVQLDFKFHGTDWTTAAITAMACRRLRAIFAGHGIAIVAVSGHANLVAPDPARRAANRARIVRVVECARELGASLVVTETGTRHPTDDWAAHPDSASPETFAMFRDEIGVVADLAAGCDVTVLIEGAVGNAIDTPEKAARLFREVPSRALGLVLDPANYLDAGNLDRQGAIIEALFDPALASRAAIAHAKDVRLIGPDGARRERHANLGSPDPRAEWPAPGLGDMDFDSFARHLVRDRPAVPVMIEHVDEPDLPRARRFVEARLAAQ